MPSHKQISTKDSFADYIESNISRRIAQRSGSVMKRYMSYVIDAILHGYVIRIGDTIKFSFVKVPIGEFPSYSRIRIYRSSLTSDWIFFVDIECKIMKDNNIAFRLSKKLENQIMSFINSEKVYELIR